MKGNYWHQVKLTLSLFTKKDRKTILKIIYLQTVFSILDLVGVALIGFVGALAVRGIKSEVVGDRTRIFLKFAHIENLNLQEQIFFLSFTAVVIFVFKTLVNLYFSRKILIFLNFRGADITSNLFKKIMQQPVDYVNSRSIQETIWILNSGVTNLTVGILTSVTTILSDLALLFLLSISLFVIDPITTLTSFLIFTIIAISLYIYSHKKMLYYGNLRAKLDIKTNQQISQGLASYREIFVKNRRNFYARKSEQNRYSYAVADAEMRFIPTISKYAVELAIILGAFIVTILQFKINDTSRAIATLSLFIAASTRVAPAILRIQQGFVQLKGFIGTSQPTFDLITSLSKVEIRKNLDKDYVTNVSTFSPTIKVNNLSFYYSNSNSNVLSELNLNLEAGKFLAIVGASGAGKSTLVDLLLGILNPISGEILISNLNPLDAINQFSGEIAYVPQDVSISEGTIKENVAIGFEEGEYSDQQILNAIKIAQLDDFVNDCKFGLDTQVGDRGTSLSGGQRQRLGIARAILTNPKLLVLDEATSSLDAESESRISEALLSLKGDVTVVVVAHRLSTVRHADEIIYLESGKIAGVGNFDKLRALIPEFEKQAQLMGL